MELYLMQHGSSFSKEVNPEQPLSPLGQEQIQKAGRVAAKLGQSFGLIASSNKLRARQSARIMASATAYPANKILASDIFNPTAPVPEALEYIASLGKPESLLICGHLPQLDHLASQLLCGCSLLHSKFENGCLMRLDVTNLASSTAVLRWFLSPQHLQLLAAQI